MASKARNEMQAVFSKKETRSKSVKRKAWTFGGVAQLGEHLPCKQGVRSSILLISTKGSKRDSEMHQANMGL